MHLIKDADAVKRMFCHGQFSAIDAEARYTYSLSATCPRCGAQAFVTRYEQSPVSTSLNRASMTFC